MWSKREKALVHIYKAAAKLDDEEYREILFDATGARSAADRGLTQAEFEMAMASLEARLEYAINNGMVERPKKGRIRNLNYWRDRLPRETGRITDRQLNLICRLLKDLEPHVSAIQNEDAYLAGMVKKATGAGTHDNVIELKVQEASALIDALKDRLAYARKTH